MEERDLLPSVRWIHDFAARWQDLDFISRELRLLLTDDFERVDHRRLVGVPGVVGPDEYVEQQKSFADAGSTRPTVDLVGVLATRGDRCVAMRARIVHPNGAASEMISVRTFDAAVERCARLVLFDAEDVELALAELERQASAISRGA